MTPYRDRTIYIADDEESIRELLTYNLEQEGYRVEAFPDGVAFLEALGRAGPLPDLAVLDVMMPGPDGFEICRAIREDPRTHSLPVILLTARGGEIDRVVGLDLGADDYLVKPFSVRELKSRIRNTLRRCGETRTNLAEAIVTGDRPAVPALNSSAGSHAISGSASESCVAAAPTEPGVIRAGRVVLDDRRRRVMAGEKEIVLTRRAYELLRALLANRGIVLSREVLLDKVWGYTFAGGTRTVDIHVGHLRALLHESGEDPIETVRGIGYRYRE